MTDEKLVDMHRVKQWREHDWQRSDRRDSVYALALGRFRHERIDSRGRVRLDFSSYSWLLDFGPPRCLAWVVTSANVANLAGRDRRRVSRLDHRQNCCALRARVLLPARFRLCYLMRWPRQSRYMARYMGPMWVP